MKRALLPSLAALALLSAPATASAQWAVSSTAAAFQPIASVPGIGPVTVVPACGTAPCFTNRDDSAVTVPIGFGFNYLGRTYTQVAIHTNGYISFDTAAGTVYSNTTFGGTSNPNNFIAPWWDDLVMYTNASAAYGVAGRAPSRVFVVELREFGHINGGAMDGGVWQIRLHEGYAGRFEIYAGGTLRQTYSASSGFEGPNGSPSATLLGCTPSCDSPAFNAAVGTKVIVTRPLPPRPELTTGFIRVPTGALPGQSASATVELINYSARTATTVVSRLWLSSDMTLDARDTLVATATTTNLRTATATITFTVPAGQMPGTYALLFQIDAPDAWREMDETDNLAVSPTAFAVGHDLVARAITTVTPPSPGDPLQLSLDIGNVASPFTGVISVRVVASPDTILDVTDTAVVTATVGITGAPAQNVRIDARFPNVRPGRYYLIVELDSAGQVAELNEGNNVTASTSAIAVGPDFSVASVTVPMQIGPGQTAPVSVVIASNAAPHTGPVEYRLFASSDNMLDAADVALGTYSVGFAGEASRTGAEMVAFPAALPGRVFVIARVDPMNAIAEVDEQNNLGVSMQALSGYDFRVANVGTTAMPTAQDMVTITGTVQSLGLPYNGDLTLRVYLSGNQTFDPGAVPISTGMTRLPGLNSAPFSLTFRLPREARVGAWYIHVVVDPDNAVPESDETNNAGSSTTQLTIPGSELFITSITGPTTGFAGLPYPVELEIENTGTVDARGFRFAIYSSTNDIIRITDTEVYLSPTTTIAAGRRRIFQVPVTLPAITATTSIYIGAIADVFSQVRETAEANNTRRIDHPVRVVFPIPDLSAEIVQTATAAGAGEPFAVTRIVRNTGVAAAGSFEYTYYLSPNPMITTDDLAVGTFTSSLAAGTDTFGIDVLEIPANVLRGRYFLGVIVDPRRIVDEVREDDNVYVGPELEVYEAAIRFRTDTLPNATLGVPYEIGIYAAGGPLGRTWTVSAGRLPMDLGINASTGIISGTPREEGSFTFTVRASSGSAFAEKELTLRVVAPTIPLLVASQSLIAGIVGRPYRVALVAAGGAPPYEWSLASAVPPGLTLSPGGVLSGRPTAPGGFRLAARVRDSLGNSAAKDLALNVINPNQSVLIVQLALPEAVIDVDYCDPEPIKLEAMGGIPPYRWSLEGTPPPGFTFSPEGELCGTPAEVGQFTLSVRAQDSTGLFDTALFVLTVDDGTGLAITTPRLDPTTLDQPYSAKLTAIRGDAPYVWSVAGGALPPGITLSPNGDLTGRATAAGAHAFIVQVVDSKNRIAVRPFSIVVEEPPKVVEPEDGGCGCSAAPTDPRGGSGSALAGLALAGLLLARRRRALLALLGVAVLAGAARDASAQTPVPGTPYTMTRRAATYVNLTMPNIVLAPQTADLDTSTAQITLPFPFKYYGMTYTSIVVGVNGAMFFGTSGLISDDNRGPGIITAPNAVVAPFWDDLFLDQGQPGNVSYQIEGTAPQRRVAIQWKDIDRYNLTTPHMNFQVRLFEGPAGRLTVSYGPVGSTTGSMTASMGMEDEAGMRPIRFDPPNAMCPTIGNCALSTLMAMIGQQIELRQDPGVELAGLGANPPQYGYLGAPMPVEVVLENLHGQAVGPFRYAIALSRTADFANPITVFTSQPVTFPPFLQQSVTVDVIPPMSLPVGEYYVAVLVDPANEVMEIDEVNNRAISARPVRILRGAPDLAVLDVRVDRTRAMAGGMLTVYSTVANVGSNTVPSARFGIVLSTNPAISRQDVIVGELMVTLAPGQTVTTTTTVTLPMMTQSGTYYFGTLADPDEMLTELSESNNGRAAFRPVAVTGGNLAILTTQLPQGQRGAIYTALLSAIGGESGYTWAITSGRLPDSLGLLPASGEIFGRPSAEGTFTFTVQVTSGSQSVSKQLTIVVADPDAPLTIVSRSLPPAVVGQEYSARLLSVGGTETGTHTWSATGVPEGLMLMSTGALVGTPRAAGTATIAVTLTDGMATTMRGVVLPILEHANLLIDPKPLDTATYNASYMAQLTASGGQPPLTWILKSGVLPKGVSLSTGGLIMGTPTEVGTFRVVIEVRDSASGGLSARDANTFELVVADVPGFEITTNQLPEGTVGRSYEAQITATGGMPPFTWRIVEGRLPDKLASEVVPETSFFRIVGAPEAADVTNLLIQVTDDHGRTTRKAFALRVNPALVVTSTPADSSGCRCVAPAQQGDWAAWAVLGLALLGMVLRLAGRAPRGSSRAA